MNEKEMFLHLTGYACNHVRLFYTTWVNATRDLDMFQSADSNTHMIGLLWAKFFLSEMSVEGLTPKITDILSHEDFRSSPTEVLGRRLSLKDLLNPASSLALSVLLTRWGAGSKYSRTRAPRC